MAYAAARGTRAPPRRTTPRRAANPWTDVLRQGGRVSSGCRGHPPECPLCDDGAVTTLVLETAHGPAHAHIYEADAPRGVLVLGHGAGGGVAAKDLVAAQEVGARGGSRGGARRAALPRRGPPLAAARGAPRCRLDGRRRCAASHLVPRAAARRRRALVGRARRLPHRRARPARPAFSASRSRFSHLRASDPSRGRAGWPSSMRSRSRRSSSRASEIRSACRPPRRGGKSAWWPAITACDRASARRRRSSGNGCSGSARGGRVDEPQRDVPRVSRRRDRGHRRLRRGAHRPDRRGVRAQRASRRGDRAYRRTACRRGTATRPSTRP